MLQHEAPCPGKCSLDRGKRFHRIRHSHQPRQDLENSQLDCLAENNGDSTHNVRVLLGNLIQSFRHNPPLRWCEGWRQPHIHDQNVRLATCAISAEPIQESAKFEIAQWLTW